jgi:2,3-bisphosphoglycerate-dependent phosphoglycerate mutase
MRLYFIRHGQSENNALYENTGSDIGRVDDPRLTAIGEKQADATAKFLSSTIDPIDRNANGNNFGFTHLYCSPMNRAIATGMYIAEAMDLPLGVLKDWHETGGIFLEDKQKGTFIQRPGMTHVEMLQLYPKLIINDTMNEDGWWNRPREEEAERPVRARRALCSMLEMHPGVNDRVAVISHGGFYNQFMAAVLNLDAIRPVWFDLYNCGITRFNFNSGNHSIVYHNYTAHLEKSLMT